MTVDKNSKRAPLGVSEIVSAGANVQKVTDHSVSMPRSRLYSEADHSLERAREQFQQENFGSNNTPKTSGGPYIANQVLGQHETELVRNLQVLQPDLSNMAHQDSVNKSDASHTPSARTKEIRVKQSFDLEAATVKAFEHRKLSEPQPEVLAAMKVQAHVKAKQKFK